MLAFGLIEQQAPNRNPSLHVPSTSPFLLTHSAVKMQIPGSSLMLHGVSDVSTFDAVPLLPAILNEYTIQICIYAYFNKVEESMAIIARIRRL